MFVVFLAYLFFPVMVKRNYERYRTMTLRKDAYSTLPDPMPLVSVIVPARNEEKTIGKCLISLIEQDYPNIEIIAVNDNSTDRTAAIIEDIREKDTRVQLVDGEDLPPGWMGKNFAVYQGVQHAKGEYLLFVDADEWFNPRCISRTICYALEHGSDLLILMPGAVRKGFWERLIFPVYTQITWSTLPFSLLEDNRSHANLGGGPYLLFKREAYEDIGGHERIRGEIVEDMMLVRAIKKSGLKLSYLFGHELLTLGSYGNLSNIWRQLSKSYFSGIGRKAWIVGESVFLLFSFLILPWVSVILSLSYLMIYPWGWFPFLVFLLGMGQCISALFLRYRLKQYISLDNTYSLLQPLAALMIMGIMIHSTAKGLYGKGTTWKGRSYC